MDDPVIVNEDDDKDYQTERDGQLDVQNVTLAGVLGFLLGLGAFLILMFRNKQAAQPYFHHLEMIGFSQKDTKRLFKLENQILYLSAAIPALLVLLLLAAFAPTHLPTVLIGWLLLTAAGLVVVEMR
jgi:hypothetical protein